MTDYSIERFAYFAKSVPSATTLVRHHQPWFSTRALRLRVSEYLYTQYRSFKYLILHFYWYHLIYPVNIPGMLPVL